MKLTFHGAKTLRHGPPLKLPPLSPGVGVPLLAQAERVRAEAVAVSSLPLKHLKLPKQTATEAMLGLFAAGNAALPGVMEQMLQNHAVALERLRWRMRLRRVVAEGELRRRWRAAAAEQKQRRKRLQTWT